MSHWEGGTPNPRRQSEVALVMMKVWVPNRPEDSSGDPKILETSTQIGLSGGLHCIINLPTL